jgi:hypothetical protein
MENEKFWAEVIMLVRSGKMTAKEAALKMGVSRKTYYEKEARALSGMLNALKVKDAGRPPEDAEKEALKRRVASLEKDLLIAKETYEVREMLRSYEELKEKKRLAGLKKKPSSERGCE